MPEITVVITAYQLERYLDQCLKELFDQTFQDFDLLLVDDCSKDRTREIIEQWKLKYPERIKTLFLQKNLGMPSKTRNAALDSGLIDGRYFVFLDGDDAIEPFFLEKLHTAAVKYSAQVAVCAYDRVEAESGRRLCEEMKGFPAALDIPPNNDILAFVNTSPWNKLWETSLFGDGRFPLFKVGEEVVLQFTRYVKAKRIAFVDDVLIHYRVREGSVISNTPEESIWQFANELKSCYDSQNDIFRETVALMTFLHIGISMALRAADNPDIDLKNHLKKTSEFFKREFAWFRTSRFLKFRSLAKHGFKGVALWACLCAYRVRCFGLVLHVFRFATSKLHVDIKF